MAPGFTLNQIFVHKTSSHEFSIRWTRLGTNSAPPLILIHGTPWSSAEWENLVRTLSSRYSIYIYDHPGFGQSPSYRRLTEAKDADRIDLDGSLKLRAEGNAALIKHWDLKYPPHVVAHDNGGLVSMRLLLQHGIKFASLCLVDVVVLPSSGLPFFKLVAENESVFAAIPPNMIEGLVRAYVKSATYHPVSRDIEDQLSAPWSEGGSQGSKRFLQEMIQANNRDVSDVEGDYHTVGQRVPTKIIWGRDDAWLPVDIAPRLQKALNAESVVILEEAGHLCHFDQPSKLALEIGLWLNQHDKK